MKNSEFIKKIAQEEDSFYLYDEEVILERINNLKENFPSVEFLYSLKTNPNPDILDTIYDTGLGADAASLKEVEISFERIKNKEKIQYSAPGKSEKDIEESFDKAIIIADSINEVKLISEVAVKNSKEIEIGIRINPNFTFTEDKGMPGKFGIDEDLFFEKLDEFQNLPNIKISGIHVHSKSQELNYKIIENYYKNLLDLTVKVEEKLNGELKFVNMGSGIGIPYEEDDKEVDIETLGNSLEKFLKESSEKLQKTKFYIETGRYLVGKSGIYVTKVRDKKSSFGKNFVILNNTLNGFYRPSISQMVSLYTDYKNAPANEPLYTSPNSSQFYPLEKRGEKETVTIMGNLCTAADVIEKEVVFPKLEIGDIVIFNNAGSYSIVLTPMQFASMERPKEFLLKKDKSIKETK